MLKRSRKIKEFANIPQKSPREDLARHHGQCLPGLDQAHSTLLLEHLEISCRFPVWLIAFVHTVCQVGCGQHSLCKHLQYHHLCIIYRGLMQIKQQINLPALVVLSVLENLLTLGCCVEPGKAKKTKSNREIRIFLGQAEAEQS